MLARIIAIACLAAMFGLAPKSAAAQSTDHLVKMLALLKKENASCTFVLNAAGTISASYNLTSEFIVLWVYTVQGCNGTRTTTTSADAYYVREPPKGAALIKKIPLSDSVKDQTLFNWVKGVSFKGERNAPTSYVEIDGLNLGEDDARCCPTEGQQVKLWIEDGKIKSTIVKSWKEPK